MRYISADYIFPISSPPIKNGIVGISDDGEISHITSNISHVKPEIYNGIICPGFINTHCHSELSYLKGHIPEQKGLDEFINEVEKLRRNFSEEEIKKAVIKADEEMQQNGIVAVGDICNSNISFEQKKNSQLYYHNFIEVFAFHPDRADAAFEKGLKLFTEYVHLPRGGDREGASITPHAPYSASEKLLKKISDFTLQHNSILSIHNQENYDEDFLFKKKEGKILERLKKFGVETDFWKATGKSSVRSVLPHLPEENNLLLVHNTCTQREDIQWVHQHRKNTYWCFCPNANLYIENTLPDFNLFISERVKITIGTDSLASNHQLSVLEELKTISKHSSAIPLQTLLTWATKNGAEFLGLEKKFGTIEKGKKPGLVLIENLDVEKIRLTDNSKARLLL